MNTFETLGYRKAGSRGSENTLTEKLHIEESITISIRQNIKQMSLWKSFVST